MGRWGRSGESRQPCLGLELPPARPAAAAAPAGAGCGLGSFAGSGR